MLGSVLLAYALIRRNSEVAKLSLALFAALAVVAVAVFLTASRPRKLSNSFPVFRAEIRSGTKSSREYPRLPL